MKCIQQITNEMIERSFWQLTVDPGDSVTVKYGADLFTDTLGSGFARARDTNVSAEQKVCTVGRI
jgi:hypothetical protein